MSLITIILSKRGRYSRSPPAMTQVREPMTLRTTSRSQGLQESLEGLEQHITQPQSDTNLLEQVMSAVEDAKELQNHAYDEFVSAFARKLSAINV
jgi:hypothetical protein